MIMLKLSIKGSGIVLLTNYIASGTLDGDIVVIDEIASANCKQMPKIWV